MYERTNFLLHSLCLTPLATLIWDSALLRLGPHPTYRLIHVTGFWALSFLLLSLSVTPLRRLTSWNRLFMWRRSFGLYAFLYAALHVLLFALYESGFSQFFQEVVSRRYTLAGLAAFLLLVPLAVTSTKEWQKRLKKNWRRLHLLVFPAGALAILHFFWLVKWDATEPARFAAVFGILVFLRLATAFRSLKRSRAE